MILFLGRNFNWQPSECEDMPLEDLVRRFWSAVKMLKDEAEARRAAQERANRI